MIDHIKIKNLVKGLQIQKLLDFEIKVNENTGEELAHRKKSAYLKNLIFTITPGERFVKCQGSLHKYANGGERNNDRFTFTRFLNVANELKEYISPDDIINTLEFGVNIHTFFNPTEFINNLIAHLHKPFNKTVTPEKVYSQIEYSHFILKIYNKGLQQPTGENILRIEVKYLRMQKLFPSGLKWSDLSNLKTWERLADILRDKFNEVIFYDPSIDLNKVPERDRKIIEKGHNPIFWERLSGPHVSRSRKQYQNLIYKYGTMFSILPSLLDQELKEVVKSYQFSGETKETINSTDIDKMVNCYPLLYGNFSPYPLNASSETVFCKVTGIPISMQKSGSKFLCISGIRKLFESDPLAYERLRAERLSERWLSESREVQFREIAHSIRNEYFNRIHNAKRDISNLFRYPVLFDLRPLIRTDKIIEAGL